MEIVDRKASPIKAPVIFVLLLLTNMSLLSLGCAANKATATVNPKAELSKIKTVSVIPYDLAASEVAQLIERRLKIMGYQVISNKNTNTQVDAIVTFKDIWSWDITTYMLELTIVIREPNTEFPLANGNSFHTSLTRKSPDEMVEEVLNNIFKQGR
jgi:hypothetical protein